MVALLPEVLGSFLYMPPLDSRFGIVAVSLSNPSISVECNQLTLSLHHSCPWDIQLQFFEVQIGLFWLRWTHHKSSLQTITLTKEASDLNQKGPYYKRQDQDKSKNEKTSWIFAEHIRPLVSLKKWCAVLKSNEHKGGSMRGLTK